MDVDHGTLRALPGHGVPRAIWILDPLRSLTVELALVGRLQVEDGEAEGASPQLVQPHLTQALPLGIFTAGVQDEVSAQGNDLHRVLTTPLPQPGYREVGVLDCLSGHFTAELQRVLFYFVQSLGDSRGLQRIWDHCNTECSHGGRLQCYRI